ncbi:MAG TPA: chlorite dismutase family protein [Acidimicrobiales bacterium]|nr:chlorite dismutase family protein [Acidimicrobiales bacterium]
MSLFAVRPDDLKECVHTMRFDAASAHYAEFGPFVTGLIAPLAEILRRVGLG